MTRDSSESETADRLRSGMQMMARMLCATMLCGGGRRFRGQGIGDDEIGAALDGLAYGRIR